MILLFSFQVVYLGFARFALNHSFVYQKETNNAISFSVELYDSFLILIINIHF